LGTCKRRHKCNVGGRIKRTGTVSISCHCSGWLAPIRNSVKRGLIGAYREKLLRKLKTLLTGGLNLIASFLQQATAQGTRSTVMNPLGWFFGMCVAGLLIAASNHAPVWIDVLLGSFSTLAGLAYLGAYIFCLLTRREHLLRTEKFVLQQLAIEKGFRGDSLTGIIRSTEMSLIEQRQATNQGGGEVA
jgi:hypothetical protein